MMSIDSSAAEPSGFFNGWSMRRKLSLAVGVLVIIALVVWLAWWAQRSPKAVLFADLSERDAGVIAAELDKLKQPYSFSDDGRAILMSADTVHRTRLALMGKSLPLHGAVGFELFNNADFGVSDFVQKVNYQRALQGELTRTILSLEEVQDVRVHLALPDQALFRKEGPKAKASVTVSLRGGRSLRPEQVVGIQRLTAASVPEVKTEDVTVLDQHGVVLSRVAADDAAPTLGQLDAKQSLEAHLSRKASRLLDQMFSAGEAMVAVDVVLNHEQSKVTTEEVLGAGTTDRVGHPAGVITRERSVTKEPTGGANGNDTNAAQVVTQETDYAAGRRVAQTVSQGGKIAQLNVAVVVRRPLSETELSRVKQLVATAVGLQSSRGDLVTVHSLASLQGVTPAATASAPLADAPVDFGASADRVVPPKPPQLSASILVSVVLAALVALALLLAFAVLKRRACMATPQVPQGLTEQERQAMLASLKRWLEPQP